MKVFLIFILCPFFIFWQVFYWVYFWQLKEYRFDRLKSAITEKGLISSFFPKHFYKPIFTKKSLLLLLLSGFFSIALAFVSPVLYLLTPLIVAFFVLLTAVPTFFYKFYITERAEQKIDLLKSNGLKVIGVTGSYGKTSTKELIADVLEQKYEVVKTPKNHNTLIGISKAALSLLKKDTKFFVVEIGAYKRGEISKICKVVKPDFGVITGLCPQHLALFNSWQKLVAAKFELAEAVLAKDGVLFMNADDSNLAKEGLKPKGEKIWYKTGKYHLPNFAAAEAVGKYFGLRSAALLGKKASTFLKIEEVKLPSNLVILNDTYSSNPVGFEYALEILANYPRKNKIVITSGIIELGSVSGEIHKNLGAKAREIAKTVILTKREFAKSFDGELIEDPKKILERVYSFNPKETVVLLEGRLNLWLIRSLLN